MPLFAVLAGIGGLYLRFLERANVFDQLTGLPERNATFTLWLFILSAAFIISIIVFAIYAYAKHRPSLGFENAFGTDPLAYPIIFTFIGLVWLAGTYLFFSDLSQLGSIATIDVIFIVFSSLAAISTTFFAIEMFQDSRRKAPYALSVVPTLFVCFWLILMYRQNASNPVLLDYVYKCLALMASALSFYFTSGFLYGKPAPGKAIFTYFAAIYFCTVTLADDHPLSIKIIYFAMIAVNIIHSSMLLKNLRRKEKGYPGGFNQHI